MLPQLLVQSIEAAQDELLVELLEVINAIAYMDKFIFTNPQSDLEGSIICQLEEAGLEKALEDLIQLYS